MPGAGPTVQLHAREGPPSCSYCRGECADAAARVTCGSCQAAYHDDCLAELGACATLGCARPRASAAPRPRVVIRPLACCRETSSAGGPVVVCDACGGRWHEGCAARQPGGACCAGHGVTPEVRLAARDTGPRVGTRRRCARCPNEFVVVAATRFNPLCGACRARAAVLGLLACLALFVLYLVLGTVGLPWFLGR